MVMDLSAKNVELAIEMLKPEMSASGKAPLTVFSVRVTLDIMDLVSPARFAGLDSTQMQVNPIQM